ncbi:hypothetical protein [Siansivirga zeaxanthinifaciens]|uniref:hypothetical protein n=1 Tax=Siansivirga zeaxanthinifaciens TaxID=762954 RepID=UPI0012B644FD|nr:hypothetical protein [Siansivirga zeaxanthinifaciens]
MKRHFLTSIGILIFLVSCKQKETQKMEIPEQKPTTELKVENKIATEQFVENDSLAFALESELEKFALQNSMFKTASKAYQNHHDKTVIDTIKTLTYDKSELEFYKSATWEHIIGGIIKNPEIVLSKSLKIGIQKSTLENKLKTKITSDLVILGNLEQTSLFTFHFENGILESIKFQGYFD